MQSKWKFITDAVPISIGVSKCKEIETPGPSGLYSQIQLQLVESENSITKDEENDSCLILLKEWSKKL
jgi:hypothetical protein